MTTTRSISRVASALALLATAALSACGGGDDHQSSANPIAANVLYLEDANTGKIAAFPSTDPASGTAFSSHVVASVDGASGQIAYDGAHDVLFVAVADTTDGAPVATIQVFTNATTMTAGVPARTITFEHGVASLVRITKLAYDAGTDTLWAYGRNGSGLILITGGTALAYDAYHDTAYVTGTIDTLGNAVPASACSPAPPPRSRRAA